MYKLTCSILICRTETNDKKRLESVLFCELFIYGMSRLSFLIDNKLSHVSAGLEKDPGSGPTGRRSHRSECGCLCVCVCMHVQATDTRKESAVLAVEGSSGTKAGFTLAAKWPGKDL